MTARIEVADDAAQAELEEILGRSRNLLGFVPNAMQIMARRPAILAAFSGLFGAVFGPDSLVDAGLKEMVAHIASRASGCQYCQAHTGHLAETFGAPAEKMEAIWDYERSDLFSDAERAALRLAQGAGVVPNGATDEDFEELKRHFSEDEIVEVLAVIALYGFLNRWNDTLATDLEESAVAFGNSRLRKGGWTGGKHLS